MASPAGPPPGRNEPCHCGSGKKYKHCCLAKDEKKAAKARAKATADTVDQPSEPAPSAPARPPTSKTQEPWRATTSRGFVPRARSPRKVGGG